MRSRCGTVIGYLRHHHRGTAVCDRCQGAWNAHNRRSKQQTRPGYRGKLMDTRPWPRCLTWNAELGQCTEVENHGGDCVWAVAS